MLEGFTLAVAADLTVSIARSLRSTCGSSRRPPESSIQRFPGRTQHVGQGTELNSSGDIYLKVVRACDKRFARASPGT